MDMNIALGHPMMMRMPQVEFQNREVIMVDAQMRQFPIFASGNVGFRSLCIFGKTAVGPPNRVYDFNSRYRSFAHPPLVGFRPSLKVTSGTRTQTITFNKKDYKDLYVSNWQNTNGQVPEIKKPMG